MTNNQFQVAEDMASQAMRLQPTITRMAVLRGLFQVKLPLVYQWATCIMVEAMGSMQDAWNVSGIGRIETGLLDAAMILAVLMLSLPYFVGSYSENIAVPGKACVDKIRATAGFCALLNLAMLLVVMFIIGTHGIPAEYPVGGSRRYNY